MNNTQAFSYSDLSLSFYRGPVPLKWPHFSLFSTPYKQNHNIWYQSSDPRLGNMTETRSNSQNFEKIAALSKITDNHEQTLRKIKKQLQTLTTFMQKWADFEEQRQQSP